MNLLADEGVERQIVERLRADGHAVLYIAEMEPSIPDDAVLDRANQISALLVAADKDFGELLFRERRLSSGGVVLIRLAGLSAERKAAIVSKAFAERGSDFAHAFSVISPGRVRVRPCAEVPLFAENNQRTRYLTDEEEPRLLAALTGRREHLRPLVMVAIGTGMRLGDQLSLRWHQVDFQHNVIRVPNSKTGRYYGVPMNHDVRRELQALKRAAAGGEYVFVSNDLRHTFDTRLGAAGYNAYEVAELVGHADIKTSARYVHPADERKQAAVEATRITAPAACHSPATEAERPPMAAAVNS